MKKSEYAAVAATFRNANADVAARLDNNVQEIAVYICDTDGSSIPDSELDEAECVTFCCSWYMSEGSQYAAAAYLYEKVIEAGVQEEDIKKENTWSDAGWCGIYIYFEHEKE